MSEYYQISIQWHLNPTTFITFLMKNSLMFFMELVSIGSYEFEYRSVGPLKGPNPTLLTEISDLCELRKIRPEISFLTPSALL